MKLVLLLREQQHQDDDDDEGADADIHVPRLAPAFAPSNLVSQALTKGTNADMIGFFILLVVLMVLVAVCIPWLQGGGRRIYVDRRPDYVEEVVDDGYASDEVLRPVARRRMVRRRRLY